MRTQIFSPRAHAFLLGLVICFATPASPLAVPRAAAQGIPNGQIGVEKPAPADPAPGAGVAPTPAAPDGNTTVVPRSPTDGKEGAGADTAQLRLVALLTADGQRIDQGLVWRVFREKADTDGKIKLLSTHHEGSPTLRLQPGDYVINAAFGRAHLTRKISVKLGATGPAVEQFVLNAGGLRVRALLQGKEIQPGSVTYDIYSDRDQSDSRKLIMAAAKPGLIMRLNAGIYHIGSTYGDANATVQSDVTVEAGKLTEATISHAAAKATFKLVARAGGEALPDTQWSIQTPQGEEIKGSVGALPTHILAPGTYTVIAKSQGKAFQREFTLADGETTQVEVIMK